MLKVSWRGKVRTVEFKPELERYGEDWPAYVTLEDLIAKLSADTSVPTDRIKVLHSGVKSDSWIPYYKTYSNWAMMKDLNATLQFYKIKSGSRLMMIGDVPMAPVVPNPNQELLDKLKAIEAQVNETIIPKLQTLERALSDNSLDFKQLDYLSKEVSELLLQMLLKVDGVQSHTEDVRSHRKETVRVLNQYLDQVDSLKPRIAMLKSDL